MPNFAPWKLFTSVILVKCYAKVVLSHKISFIFMVIISYVFLKSAPIEFLIKNETYFYTTLSFSVILSQQTHPRSHFLCEI